MSTDTLPMEYDDVYYHIAMFVDSPRDLMNYAAVCKTFRYVTAVLLYKSTPGVCVKIGHEDSTSYASKHYSATSDASYASGKANYVLFNDWCDGIRTSPMHPLQKTQQYKNIRSMYFMNVFYTPTGGKLPFTRCMCGLLTSNRLILNVDKLDIVYSSNNAVARFVTSGFSPCSRRLVITTRHLCSKCMYKIDSTHQSPIALNNYAKATLGSTLHLNGSKIFIHNLGYTTKIE
jgi:hypothetical protein